MEREAYLYGNVKEDKVECLTCQRRCIISEGKSGWCHTRVNKRGKLYSLIYGEVSSLSINPVEKKPVFHFYPGSRWLSLGSLGCNFRKDYRKILEITKKAKEHGMHVEVVTNIIPRINDDEKELRDIASWIKDTIGPETPWHVTRFYPHLELSHLPPTPLAVLERAWSIGKEEGLWYVYVGNVPGHKLENTYCHVCGELMIERYIFEIMRNRIKDGKCPKCNAVIPGRFLDV
jgi:hypothetical protein